MFMPTVEVRSEGWPASKVVSVSAPDRGTRWELRAPRQAQHFCEVAIQLAWRASMTWERLGDHTTLV